MSTFTAPRKPASTPKARGLGMLLDVPLLLTVELGSTSMTFSELLRLGGGSIVELDRLAGEPLDLMINGKLIARGQIVAINDRLGLRVTEIATGMHSLLERAVKAD